MSDGTHYLLLFAKYPYHGKVKTRLEPALGVDHAHQFARIALIETLQYFGQLNGNVIGSDGLVCKCVWCFAPSEAEDDVESLLKEFNLDQQWTTWPQLDTAPSLGHRLSAALAQVDNEVAREPSTSDIRSTCTFIGSDCFHMKLSHITDSMQTAGANHAKILPAADGGYTLLSLPLPAFERTFDKVRWSSVETADDQIIQLQRVGYSVEFGETLSDVDDPEDLQRLLQQCRGADGHHLKTVYPRTITFIQQHMKT